MMFVGSLFRAARNRPLAAFVLLAVVTSLGLVAKPMAAHAATAIRIDGAQSGRVFDGVGAISGGGGNSRLLYDYPATQRGQILDYLFKPGYGASLQILKVEVGGDTNSTDGSEPSHMHSATDENYQRGYEWWLMKEAKTRNPNIKLAALSWGAPGWIGNGNFWSQDMINYLVKWIQHAKSDHNLTIDYIGGWNERGANKQWFINLKSALTSNNLPTKVIANENFGWEGADEIAGDTAYKNAVDIVGSHYACGYLNEQTSCPSTATAVGLGKPLWASESGSQDLNTGAAAVARGINRGYIDGKMTAFINWPLVAALYQNLHFSTAGLAMADQPWSGAYSLGKTTWALAHTAQFTQPGWRYIDSASGYLGGARTNGSYVSLKSPNATDYSAIIETMDATADQTANFTIAGGLSTGVVRVWATNMRSNTAADHFVRQADITPAANGTFSLTLKPGYVYSLTTTNTQGKGTVSSPARAPLTLPYSDNFDSYANNRSPRYFTDMNGSFETLPCAAGRTGQCLRQMAPATPIRWTDEPFYYPYSLMGEQNWSNYTVSADMLLEQAGSLELLGRVGQQAKNNNGLNAYHLRISNTGAWSILKSNSTWTFTTLKSGTATGLGINQWHKVALAFQGTTITAQVDGTTIGTVTDSTYSAGQVGLGMSGYHAAQYDNFAITAGQSNPNPRYKLINRNSGKALTVTGNATTNGALIIQSTDVGSAGQLWQITTTGGYSVLTNVGSGKVLDVPGGSTSQGTQLIQWTANGGTNQQWTLTTSGGYTTLANRNSSKLADVSGGSSAEGAAVIQWTANNGANQQWTLVEVPA